MRAPRTAAAVIAAAGALLLSVSHPTAAHAAPAPAPGAAPAPAAKPAAAPPDDEPDNLFGPVVEKVFPAVVRIHGIAAGSRISPHGTGILISGEGHILTIWTAMLSEDADRGILPKVILADGREVRARNWLRCPDLDAAVLKLEGEHKDLPHLKPGSTAGLKRGDWLLMIGNAFNLAAFEERPGVNLGVLSALVDKLDAGVRVGAEGWRYKGRALITDANNNPGGFGGPILTAEGEWVGLTGRIVAGKTTNTQINYGVPVDDLRPFLAEALARTKASPREEWSPPVGATAKPVVAGYHGIHLFRRAGQVPQPFVDRLDRRSPARKAGLLPDDLVEYVDGKLVQTADQFEAAMAAIPAGREVALTVKRGRAAAPVVVKFKLDEPPKLETPKPDAPAKDAPVPAPAPAGGAAPGAVVPPAEKVRKEESPR